MARIDSYPAIGTPADGDLIPIWDVSAGALKTISHADHADGVGGDLIVDSGFVTALANTATFKAKLLPWQASTAYTAGTFLSHAGALYTVDADFTSPASFNTTGLTAFTSYTTEEIHDLVGAMFTGNTESGVTVTYQDSDGTIDVTLDESRLLPWLPNTAYTAGTFVSYAGVLYTVNADYTSPGTFSTTGLTVFTGGGVLTTEQVQDIVGAMFTGNTESGITATYQDTDGTIDLEVTGGVGSGGATAPYLVAASNSTADYQAIATVVATASNARIAIQEALDALPADGGEVVLLPGTYALGGTVYVGADAGLTSFREQTSLRFMPGAKATWSTVTGRTPLIQVVASNCHVYHPNLTGSGSKGNGIGVQIGGNATAVNGGDQPGGVHVWSPRFNNLDTGLEFGIQPDGSQSVGDCAMHGGRITNCKVGIQSDGFVNSVDGHPFISSCNIGIRQGGGASTRNSGRIIVVNATVNQWSDVAVDIAGGRGSDLMHMWMEHTATSGPTECVRVGSSGYVAKNLHIGTMHIHPLDVTDGTPEMYGIRLYQSTGMVIDHLEFTDEMPSTALVRVESYATNTDNVIHKVSFGDQIPTDWTYSKLLSNASSVAYPVIIEQVPGIAGSLAGVVLGDAAIPNAAATFTVFRSGTTGTGTSAIYFAKHRNGHVVSVANDSTSGSGRSGLSDVLTAIVASDTHIHLSGGRFHFLDAPTGAEAWAGSKDHHSWGTPTTPLYNLTISGEGWNTILSNRTNWSGSADTEPFSFTNAQRVTIRDLVVESCGAYKSSTDAIDHDQGTDCLVERVLVRRSRARAIVFDGGDDGANARNNVVRNCHIEGRPAEPGLRASAGGSLTASTAYRYVVSYLDSDLGGAGVVGETKVSDEATITTTGTNKQVTVTLPIGPYSCTGRVIYRAPAGSSSWVRVATVADNTTLTYLDAGGAGTAVTMPVSNLSLIPAAGIELLGANRTRITDNHIDGVGDAAVGAGAAGVNIVRKGSGATTVNSDDNIVTGNNIRAAAGCGIRLLGANRNIVHANNVSNVGTVATKQQAIRVDGATSATTNHNRIHSNVMYDDQDANSPQAGKTISNVVTVASTATPTGNVIESNSITTAGASAATISDSGTSTVVRDNYGYNPVGPATLTVTASPMTVTAGSTPEVIYIIGGTVTGVTKGGVAIGTPTNVRLEPNQSIVVTYSVAPTMTRDKL